MRLSRTIPVVAIALLLGYAVAEDILTPALNSDLGNEWTNSFSFCVRALQLHGEGKDDPALEVLSAHAPSDSAKQHYKIAKSRPNDAFWKQVATAGALPAGAAPIDCEDDLSDVLDLHFYWKPGAVGRAADDAATSNFLALSALLRSIPADGFDETPDLFAQDHDTVANTYRYCFADADSFMAMVNRKLGRKP
ncbi:MAG: hypothetical protein ACLP59_34100 [Bryobacteraceae bacterium]